MTAHTSRVLLRGTVVLPDRLLRQGAVLVDGGRIAAVGAAADVGSSADVPVIDAGDGYIAPGYIDIHVHGGWGADFMDGTPEAVETATQCHTGHGTTTICPTTTTGTRQQIVAMLDACTAVREAWQPGKHAHLGGVHLYGPYFASDKIGAHPKGYERPPDPEEYLPALARGIIKVATCAAELPGAEAFYRAAREQGCLVTCGHSNSSWAEMQRGFDAGMRHVDHFWCAMSSVPSIRLRLGEPMQPSMAEFVLGTPGMSTEVIADGQHIGPELLEYTYRMLPERLILVTDANRAVDMPPGEYKIGPLDTGEPLINTGKVGVCPTGGLASSVVGMDHMVRTMLAGTSAGLVNVIRMASLTPARLIGMADETGSIQPGKRADLQVLSADLHSPRVWIGGVEWQRQSRS